MNDVARLNVTGHCSHGRHGNCAHRPGGPADGGIVLTGGGIYRCPCACHQAAPTLF